MILSYIHLRLSLSIQAVNLLSKLGYQVSALSGKNKGFLKELGAKKIISRDDFKISGKPLQSEKWDAAIDTVGGDILSTIISQIKYNGIIASTGLAKSSKLETTVFPFILRNITLAGVDCVYASYQKRIIAWKFLEDHLDYGVIENIKSLKSISDLPDLANKIINGHIKGRTVIDVNTI